MTSEAPSHEAHAGGHPHGAGAHVWQGKYADYANYVAAVHAQVWFVGVTYSLNRLL